MIVKFIYKVTYRIRMEHKIKRLNELVYELKEYHGLSEGDIIEHITKKEIKIPVTVFENKVAPLEALVKYMKDMLGMDINQISEQLNRSSKTVWATYNNAKKKDDGSFWVKDTKVLIPLSIFRHRMLSVMESTVEFLKEKHELRYNEIASVIGRDQRTVWTAYNRAVKKRKM